MLPHFLSKNITGSSVSPVVKVLSLERLHDPTKTDGSWPVVMYEEGGGWKKGGGVKATSDWLEERG